MTKLPFVNADVIALERWPTEQSEHAYEASKAAAEERERLLDAKQSFITETVFSHPSKLALVDTALARSYLVHLHVIMLPVDVAVARVAEHPFQLVAQYHRGLLIGAPTWPAWAPAALTS